MNMRFGVYFISNHILWGRELLVTHLRESGSEQEGCSGGAGNPWIPYPSAWGLGFPSPSYCFLGKEMSSELLTAHLKVARMQ